MEKLKKEEQKKPGTPQYTMSPEQAKRMLKRLSELMDVQKKYTISNYSFLQLVSDMQTNERYLAILLKSRLKTTYTKLIRRYRVEAGVRLLTNSDYDGFTLEDIAGMCGFGSRQSLHSAFVHYTGFPPSYYRDIDLQNTEGKAKIKIKKPPKPKRPAP